jgi:dTMP kinase
MTRIAQTTGEPRGKMIVLDGIDGSGKGVQSRMLHRAMQFAGLPVILTREPGGSRGAEQIRGLLVEGDPDRWDAVAELLLMYAARRSHLSDTVWPALDAGHWVISDRFADASRAFQGIAGGLGLDRVEQVHAVAVGDFSPDLVLILDLDPVQALQRTGQRGGAEDRFERKGLAYHERVRQGFRQIVAGQPERYRLIDASPRPDRVAAAILAAVNGRFGLGLAQTTGDSP